MILSHKSHYMRALGHNEEPERRVAARYGSEELRNAILAVFPYGYGELPSVAKSTYEWRRHRQPTLVSNGSSMS